MLEQRKITERKKLTIPGVTFLSIAVIALTVCGVYSVIKVVGKTEVTKAIAGDVEDEESPVKQIEYNGKLYQYNEDLITILVMGIDKEGTVEEANEDNKDMWAGGQADALFLLTLNPHDENVYILAINRNSMVGVDVYDQNGKYLGRQMKQVALQHGYGDGKELSCERQVATVSRMLYDLPIHSYVALNMEGIPDLNDALGGIKVTVLDDIIYPEYDMDLHAGQEVTLHGKQAYWYVRLRNENVYESNTLRLNRQKQYMTTFAAEAKNQSLSDIRVANNLWQIAQEYTVTDIDFSSFTYLASQGLSYNFDVNHMKSLTGETIMGEEFEEYYLDEDALKQTVVEMFYEPVEE